MGMGIAPEYQEKIFDRFFRIENATHTIKGTGLGLHLVKIAIEKHHKGKVFVHSKIGEGSTFGFWLPLDGEPKETKQEVKQPAIVIVATKEEENPPHEVNQTFTAPQEKVSIPHEVTTVNDYKSKAVQDANFVDEQTPATKEEEWEITFEVRDKKED